MSKWEKEVKEHVQARTYKYDGDIPEVFRRGEKKGRLVLRRID